VIHLEHITRTYGRHEASTRALSDVSLDIPAGSFVTVVGTSGSGKTTLLNVIGGLDSDFEGTAEVDGKNLKEMNDRALSRFRNRTVGFVFQHFHLLEHLDALQNVALGSFFSPGDDEDIERRAGEVLERVGLGEKLHQLPGQLSGGQKQRVAIARALFCRPRLILADEPTGNLDTRTGWDIMKILTNINNTGTTVICTTHNESLLHSLQKRVIALSHGRIVVDAHADKYLRLAAAR